MHFVEKEPVQKRFDFNKKLKSKKILRVPGAYNPLTAKLIDEIGYDKKSGRELVKINEKYFRPCEVDLLLGDPKKAINELKWTRSFNTLDKLIDDFLKGVLPIKGLLNSISL